MHQPGGSAASRTGPATSSPSAATLAGNTTASSRDADRKASPFTDAPSATAAIASGSSLARRAPPSPAADPAGRRRRRDHSRRHPGGIQGQWAPAADRHGQSGPSATFLQPSSATLTAHYHDLSRQQLQLQQESHQQPQCLAAVPSRNHKSVKRSTRQATAADCTMDQTPLKKARTGASPPRRFEIPPSAKGPPTASTSRSTREGSFSPLFFSHAPARHLSRPPSSTASDIAASMMSRNSFEAVTTVKLPRASVSSASPAMSGSTPGSLTSSVDMSVPSASPESRNLSPSLQIVQGISALELLESDERPTFLLDLANPSSPNHAGLNVLYYNSSLRACHEIYNLVNIDFRDPATAESFNHFKTWAHATRRASEGGLEHVPLYHEYGGITWTCMTLRQRFRFISGNVTPVSVRSASPFPLSDEPAAMANDSDILPPSVPISPIKDAMDATDYFGDVLPAPNGEPSSLGTIKNKLDDNATGPRHPDEFTNQVLQLQPTKSVFDWTRIPNSDSLPEHIRFAKSVDWASTSLGPMAEWSPQLRAMSNLIMGSPHPACMYWGPDLICIYNDAYIALAGGKHPALMGQKYIDAWAEIWPELGPVFKSALELGQATMKHDNRLYIKRDGFLEETFFSWALVPIVGFDGDVVGLYNPAFDNTLRKVNDRRMLTLREIGERTATATTVGGFWPQVQKGLEYNEFDVPFSIIYSVKEETESEESSVHSGSFTHSPQLILEGSPGVPDGHPAAPSSMDLRASDDGFAPYMRQCMASEGAPVVLSEASGTLPKDLIQGLNCRGFGDPCTTVVVFPVVPTTTKEAVAGFIVMGVNPRRPYDDNYKLFTHLISRQLATSMASVVLFEEEIRRGQRAAQLAALDRQELSMQLVLRTQEANESEYRFTRMAEFAPVGMFIADAEGHIDYCNDMWWQISGHSRFDHTELAWMNSVRNEDRPALESAWQRLLEERVTISVEFRFKHSQRNGDNTIDTWVIMSAFPEKTPEGNLKSIFGCITDISSQKWAEKVQNERREEAVELKRQQENFIDITSHEMRNPLSAVLQCADQIADNISTFTAQDDEEQVGTLLESCLEAANTINLCASHQKRIVDDILTLSKLDSNLLAVTPIDEQPVKVVQRALKMFESELMAHEIQFEFNVDDTFEEYGVEWVKLDPSRLRQVLINLMTNAIKFTQGRKRRVITVSLSASKDIKEVTSKGVIYFETNQIQRTASMDIDNVDEWGDGEKINIHCSVEDTGPGLAEEELKILFQRFQQATPRTHVQYGGSGLGLFISRILTEMQGGQIGVTSVRGSGSKFNFYIQSRKSPNPPALYERISPPFKIGPKTQTAPPPPATTSQPSGSRTALRSAAAPIKEPRFDVLIVEDNIVNQKVLQQQLRNCGNNTFVANHGREALQTLEKSRFWAGKEEEGLDISVILMDLEMPVMDGMTCARKIRELEREGTIVKHIPIIAVTAYARPEQVKSAKAAGIDDVISKPFRIPELLPKIEELVGRYKDLSVSNET